MLKLILVRGAPGSGKSTLAKTLAEKFGYIHHENDAFFVDQNGVYQFDISKHQYAKDVCFEKVRESLTFGKSVVVANTFTTLAELEPYLQLGKDKKAEIEVIELFENFGNVHNVPESVVDAKIAQFETFHS